MGFLERILLPFLILMWYGFYDKNCFIFKNFDGNFVNEKNDGFLRNSWMLSDYYSEAGFSEKRSSSFLKILKTVYFFKAS